MLQTQDPHACHLLINERLLHPQTQTYCLFFFFFFFFSSSSINACSHNFLILLHHPFVHIFLSPSNPSTFLLPNSPPPMAHSNSHLPPLPEEQESKVDDTKASLERIQKQLTTSGRFLLHGPLLKRSNTLRKWNERWFTLDPTTGKMEYRMQRGDVTPKGLIHFDANSTITVSPINFQGLKKYEGCCFYIETQQKKEFFLCAETPGTARAWVATLQAAQLVLKAHKEAVDSLSGNSSPKLGTVAAVVAAANATARESAKEIGAAMQMSMNAQLNSTSLENDGFLDDLSVITETLRVKDEELHELSKEIRARDTTIKEMAERLSETAKAAEAASSAAHIMDKERKSARVEIARLHKEFDEKLRLAALEVQDVEGKLAAAEKGRDEALQEAHTWRVELGKARERVVVIEAAVLRAEESAKLATAEAELKVKAALEREAVAIAAKEEAQVEVQYLRSQLNSTLIPKEIMQSNERDAQSVMHQPTIDVHTDEQVNISHSLDSAFIPADETDTTTATSEKKLMVENFYSNRPVVENGEDCHADQTTGSADATRTLRSTYEPEEKAEADKYILSNNDNLVNSAIESEHSYSKF